MYCNMTHISSKTKEKVDRVVLSSSGCRMKGGVLLTIFGIHIRLIANETRNTLVASCRTEGEREGEGEGGREIMSEEEYNCKEPPSIRQDG